MNAQAVGPNCIVTRAELSSDDRTVAMITIERVPAGHFVISPVARDLPPDFLEGLARWLELGGRRG